MTSTLTRTCWQSSLGKRRPLEESLSAPQDKPREAIERNPTWGYQPRNLRPLMAKFPLLQLEAPDLDLRQRETKFAGAHGDVMSHVRQAIPRLSDASMVEASAACSLPRPVIAAPIDFLDLSNPVLPCIFDGGRASIIPNREVFGPPYVRLNNNRYYSFTDEELGKGGFGKILGAKNAGNEDVAVKIVNLERSRIDEASWDKHTRYVQDEAYYLSLCNSQHILKLYDAGVFNVGPGGRDLCFVLVMEKLQDFCKYWKELPSERKSSLMLKYAEQIALGLAHLHQAGIVHRDVKPNNLLFLETPEGTSVKLCDFGIAGRLNHVTNQTITTSSGTLEYVPPELISRSSPQDQSADIYSFGALLYYLVMGSHAFTRAFKTTRQLFEAKQARAYAAPLTAPDGIKRLINEMLSPEKTERPNILEVIARVSELRRS